MDLVLLALFPLLVFGLSGWGDGDKADGQGPSDPDNQIWRGDNADNLQDGAVASDLMFGAGGNDDISGMAGDDILVGETGADTLRGGPGEDVVLGGWGQDLLFGGGDDDLVIGGTNNDMIYGGQGDDVLFGSSGADTISGDDGDDGVIGLDAREGFNTVLAAGFDLGDVRSELQATFGSDLRDSDVQRVETGLLTEAPADPAPDLLLGGKGADGLFGDRGDVMTGGAGFDVFAVYNQAGDDPVAITDFTPGEDRLVLLVDGPATGTVRLGTYADGATVVLDDQIMAFLEGVRVADILPGSIGLQTFAVAA